MVLTNIKVLLPLTISHLFYYLHYELKKLMASYRRHYLWDRCHSSFVKDHHISTNTDRWLVTTDVGQLDGIGGNWLPLLLALDDVYQGKGVNIYCFTNFPTSTVLTLISRTKYTPLGRLLMSITVFGPYICRVMNS